MNVRDIGAMDIQTPQPKQTARNVSVGINLNLLSILILIAVYVVFIKD